jgi:protease-4
MLVRALYWLLRLVVLPLWAPIRATRRRVAAGAFIHLEVTGPVVDIAPRPRLWEMRGKRPLCLHTFGALTAAIAADTRPRGLLITMKSFGGGMASATAMREAIAVLVAAGKEVVVHLPTGGGNKELYVAAAASRLLIGPQSTLAPVGFVYNTRYLKGALDKLGVRADVLSRGAYKSAGETFSRESMSEPQREQLGALLGALYAALTGSIAAGRKVSEEQAQALIDAAPMRANAAITAGLIDGAAYEDEVPALLGSRDRPATLIGAGDYLARRRARLMPLLRRRGVIAVLRLHGAIVDGAPGILGGRVAAADPVIAQVRALRSARRVRGVVLHIDSPGGSALASDRMFHELVQLAREKPLIACMSNVAASGGYYVAAAAHAIVAQPTTVTGSIGVVAARPVFEPLLKRLGIATETLQRGANAGLFAAGKELSIPERAALDREIGEVYDGFVDAVATGRNKPRTEIEAVAQGRVWTGSDAHARGLVDTLGGLDAAIDAVCKRLSMPVSGLDVIAHRPGHAHLPPLPLPAGAPREAAWVRALLGVFDLDSEFLALCSGNERVLAWSPVAARLRD